MEAAATHDLVHRWVAGAVVGHLTPHTSRPEIQANNRKKKNNTKSYCLEIWLGRWASPDCVILVAFFLGVIPSEA